jgi:hypothetical protein
MNNTNQRDFETLFNVLMPGRINDIYILAIATAEGSMSGCATYALFNTRLIDYEVMMATLVRMNLDGGQEP